MKLFELVQKKKGKETVLMVDSQTKVNARLKQLRTGNRSNRKGHQSFRIDYSVRESKAEVKYEAPRAKHY